MPRRLILFAVLGLAACAPRAEIVMTSRAAEAEQSVSVFVATTRLGEDALDFGTERSVGASFARLDISVPPDRRAGSVTYPGREIPDPQRHFLASRTETYPDANSFREALRVARLSGTRRSDEAVIYVHGFNNTFAEGVLRIAQLSSDFNLPGVAVHYSWPSAGNPLGYVYDRDSALFARDGLEELIRTVEASGFRRITIVAHSLGSLVTMEAIRQIAIADPGSADDRIDGVILISPDIDVEVFRSQVTRIGELPQPFGIFVSQRDRALALSARLTGQRERLGNVRSVQEVADLDVTILDVTNFSRGLGHFTVGTSPALISIFSRLGELDQAFAGDASGRIGLLPGTILTVQNATEIILSPVTGLAGAALQ